MLGRNSTHVQESGCGSDKQVGREKNQATARNPGIYGIADLSTAQELLTGLRQMATDAWVPNVQRLMPHQWAGKRSRLFSASLTLKLFAKSSKYIEFCQSE